MPVVTRRNAFNNNNNNPMMNDVILKHLFQLVSVQQLNTFRQVCKHWYNLSLPTWLKNGPPLALTNDGDFYEFSAKRHLSTATRGRHCSEIVGIQHYPKFTLKINKYEKQAHFVFWKLQGEWLTHLTLHYNQIPGAVRFLNILTCKFTPKLEYLEVECKAFSRNEAEDLRRALPMDVVEAENRNLKEFRVDYQELRQLPMNWKTLLSHYPNLEHFSVGPGLSGTRSSQLEQIVTAIKEIRDADKDKLNLKSLNWFYNKSYRELDPNAFQWNPLVPSVPKGFKEAKLLQLETFKIYFHEDDSDVTVNNILSTFAAASSLKKLEFYRRLPLVQEHLPPFRNMGQLASLTLSGYPAQNLLFLAELPNLRSLNLWGDLGVEDDEEHPNPNARSIISETNAPDLRLASLTQFSCNYPVKWTKADLRKLLVAWMPNLTGLEMYLNNSTFRFVCRSQPRLEHLCVYGGGVGDAGIVGLALTDGHEILYNQPNITNLRGLKSFAIDNLGKATSLTKRQLSEHSVLGGFCNLRHLQRLEITANRIDSSVARLLLRNIPFAKVSAELLRLDS